jgi:hypothetical protein
MDNLTGLFKEISERKFDSSSCFLCGCKLNSTNNSDEHVFPKWLQNEFNLQNKTLQILNTSTINYKTLKIPCCKKCNNEYLNKIEIKIKKAYGQGFTEFKKVDHMTIYLWICKIYFGILYKEMFLLLNRKDPTQGTIITDQYIESLLMIYLFLQEVRDRHNCMNFFPGSIFLVEMQNDDSEMMRWDFKDRITTHFISLRMKNIGIIAVLGDIGTTKEITTINDFYKIPLHPIQFNELCAIIFYRSLLLNRNPFFRSTQVNGSDKVETYVSPIQGFSQKPIFDEWDNDVYKEILSVFTGYPLDKLLSYKDMVMTWIRNKNGEINFIPIEENRFTDFHEIDI